jgi:hypothetical protein
VLSARYRVAVVAHSLLAVLALVIGTSRGPARESIPELLFKSGFEAETFIAPGTWTTQRNLHHLAGRDHTTGFDWRNGLAQAGIVTDAFFQYVIAPDADPATFVTTELREMPGPHGKPTRVLYLGVKGNDPKTVATSRNELDIMATPTWRQAYGRYWMYMHPDMLTKAPPKGWVMLMEWKEPGTLGVNTEGTNNWRTNIILTRGRNDGPMFWQFLRQEVQPLRRDEQKIVDVAAPVPVGRWFLLETFWRWGKDGRIWFAIDGQTVFDQFGRFEHATNPLGLKFWALFKNYRGLNWYDADLTNGDETWFAYDDVEIWSDFPGDHPMRRTEATLVESFDETPETPWGTLPSNWWLEGAAGGARARIADGRLLVDSTENKGKGCTVWLDRELPTDVEVAFDVHVVDAVKAANNMNVLFQFRDPERASLRDSRAERADGRYALYHSGRLEGAILTFLANGKPEEARLRVRQVPPFDPVVQERSGYHARAGHTYHVVVTRRDDRLTFRVDGQTLLDTKLPAKRVGAPGGYLGFRTWNTKLWWDNVVIRAPRPGRSSPTS